jgi:hypothetical protein
MALEIINRWRECETPQRARCSGWSDTAASVPTAQRYHKRAAQEVTMHVTRAHFVEQMRRAAGAVAVVRWLLSRAEAMAMARLSG